jgi:hypothetical protein
MIHVRFTTPTLSSVSRPGHYETLKVAPTAALDEIRRAYHAEARRWHPDRFSERRADEAARAEDSMRQVNEAWRVLRDPELRRRYDMELTGTSPRPRSGIHVDANNVTRIDPRLLDPTFLQERREAQADYIDNRRSAVLRYAPWVALMTLLLGIFIFTAYQGDDRPATVATTIPGPPVGVPANACVRIIGGPQLLQIPCESGIYDGRVIGAYEPGGSCTTDPVTIREVELSNGITVCLGA